MTSRTNTDYKNAFAGQTMPFAFVDLDLFDENVRDIAARAQGIPIRVATKSLRCVPLIRRVLAHPGYRGVMAYSVREAVFLSRNGIDDILVGYPACAELQNSGLAEELARGKRITLMVDSIEHVDAFDRYLMEFNERANPALQSPLGAVISDADQRDVSRPPLHPVQGNVCIDLDMSSRTLGLHFGVRRSPLATPDQALALARCIRARKQVCLTGLMGYEAQIAGLPERVPGRPLRNAVIRFLKRRSIREIFNRRARVVEALQRDGHLVDSAHSAGPDNSRSARQNPPFFVNGGGTGSLETTRADQSVTELTAGSGFFAPALFDHYAAFHHHPAVGYAIEITRVPAPGIYTCHGGGYTASGPGPDKLPTPYLPQGAELIPAEAAGEVQTPIQYRGPEQLHIGDPVFMRYAKAGEMCERFNALVCLEGGNVIGEVPTYRGEGQVFV